MFISATNCYSNNKGCAINIGVFEMHFPTRHALLSMILARYCNRNLKSSAVSKFSKILQMYHFQISKILSIENREWVNRFLRNSLFNDNKACRLQWITLVNGSMTLAFRIIWQPLPERDVCLSLTAKEIIRRRPLENLQI